MAVTVQQWEDRETWNRFVASTPHAHFQQGWEWGELAPDLGSVPLRLGAVEKGRLVGAMQIFINRLSRTGRTHFYVPRGPALREPSLNVLGPLLQASHAAGRDERSVGIRLEPGAPSCSGEWKRALAAMGLQPVYPPSQPRSSWVLDIKPDEDALLAGMKQKTRYNIRLATRKGVEVCQAGPPDLNAFYDLFRSTAQRDDFFIHPQDLYKRMFGLFWNAGSFCLLMAHYAGRPIAAVTLVRFGHTCWYLQGASSNEHRNVMAPYLLQWEAIRWAREQGCTLYDFRAVPDILREDQDMYGVYRFKEGFGGRQYTVLHTYGAPYDSLLYGLWQLYFSSRFRVENASRRRRDLPVRQFA